MAANENVFIGKFVFGQYGFAFKNDRCESPFVIRIWDKDYSMGYSIFYQIDNDSVIVTYQSGDLGERVLMRQRLLESQCKMAWNWLSTHDIGSFSTAYTNRRMQDGDQKRVEFEVGNKTKAIDFSNYHVKDIDELFDIINKIVKKELQIKL